MAIFKASGFEPVTTVRTPQAEPSAAFRSVDRGPVSGHLKVKLKANPAAISYELGYSNMVNGQPGPWTTQLVTNVRSPIIVNELIPGTIYAFQAHYMDKNGYSDRSDYV